MPGKKVCSSMIWLPKRPARMKWLEVFILAIDVLLAFYQTSATIKSVISSSEQQQPKPLFVFIVTFYSPKKLKVIVKSKLN